MKNPISILIAAIWFFAPLYVHAQQPEKLNAAEIQQGLKKLNTLGSVLYVAAHPDDENTRLIAYLANEAKLNTGYLSVTRGDGGQNLVGPEIREMLGVIRTQELLQARRIDGGKQFFTRANDFGYSKNPQETFTIWDREQILGDVVWVIRNFKPDVIITRFPTDGGGGHGHHTASAILAEEAFSAAADPNKYPEQLKYVDTWQPKAILLNTHPWFAQRRGEEFDPTGKIKIDVGAYNSLLGKSYTEIAAESRSMHKSQGFGATGSRGESIEYLQPIKGESIDAGFFQNPEFGWDRLDNSGAIKKLLSDAYQNFDPEHPYATVEQLLQANQALQLRGNEHYARLKSTEVQRMIKAVLGLYMEATVAQTSGVPGEHIQVKLEATNRSPIPIKLKAFDANNVEGSNEISLGKNEKFSQELAITIPEEQSYSQPYWLRSVGSTGMFDVSDQMLIGKSENDAALSIPFEVTIENHQLTFDVPVTHKHNDPVKGEVFQPYNVAPAVTINFDEKVHVFANEQPRSVKLTLKSGKESVNGSLSLEVPDGWRVTPNQYAFELEQKGQEQIVEFQLVPPINAGEGKIKAVAEVNGENFSLEQVTIEYDHIPNQMLLPESAAKVVKLDIQTRGQKIGYVMGAGDAIPGSLRQIGYHVDLLESNQINQENLKQYDAVILGVRALNTVKRLQYDMPKLLAYAEEGGTLIVQYNTSHRLVTEAFAPYPLKLSRDRVSVESAPVEILLPDHPALNYPNQITNEDFQSWVQERGLYFPDDWDTKYEALLSTHDPGESPKDGSLLISKYGSGHYVYTSLSWFRELPAGVPGAFRLFTNLISLGQEEPGN